MVPKSGIEDDQQSPKGNDHARTLPNRGTLECDIKGVSSATNNGIEEKSTAVMDEFHVLFRPEQKPIRHRHDGEAKHNQCVPLMMMFGPGTLLHYSDQQEQDGSDQKSERRCFKRWH